MNFYRNLVTWSGWSMALNNFGYSYCEWRIMLGIILLEVAIWSAEPRNNCNPSFSLSSKDWRTHYKAMCFMSVFPRGWFLTNYGLYRCIVTRSREKSRTLDSLVHLVISDSESLEPLGQHGWSQDISDRWISSPGYWRVKPCVLSSARQGIELRSLSKTHVQLHFFTTVTLETLTSLSLLFFLFYYCPFNHPGGSQLTYSTFHS